MPEELRMYSDTATWNIEAYHVKEVVDPEFVETAATRSSIQEYADEKDYCGMTVFFDNIKKEIFVWVAAYAKHKGWVKKLVGMHGDKFDIQFREIFQKNRQKEHSRLHGNPHRRRPRDRKIRVDFHVRNRRAGSLHAAPPQSGVPRNVRPAGRGKSHKRVLCQEVRKMWLDLDRRQDSVPSLRVQPGEGKGWERKQGESP